MPYWRRWKAKYRLKKGSRAVKTRRLTVIAEALVGLAAEGNLTAIREICDIP